MRTPNGISNVYTKYEKLNWTLRKIPPLSVINNGAHANQFFSLSCQILLNLYSNGYTDKWKVCKKGAKVPCMVFRIKSLPIKDKWTSSKNNPGYLSLNSGYLIALSLYLITWSIKDLFILVLQYFMAFVFLEYLYLKRGKIDDQAIVVFGRSCINCLTINSML